MPTEMTISLRLRCLRFVRLGDVGEPRSILKAELRGGYATSRD